MKIKRDEKMKAIALREGGYSVNEIVEKLGVAKSSVSVWVRNIPLSGPAQQRLLTKIKVGQFNSALNKRRKTAELFAGFKNEARHTLGRLRFETELDKIICSLLYWCEGAKDQFSGVRFTNSDPKLIRVFLVLLKKSFYINEDKIRIGLHLHGYHDPKRQIVFWSKITRIPKSHFIRPYLKSNTGKRIRKDYPGCATIYYHSNNTARELLATAEAFLEYVGD